MKIFITGGLGFIGKHLSDFLLDRGHQVTAVGTRPDQNLIHHTNFNYISADTTRIGPWQADLKDVDAVINLAGRSIFKRWNNKYKALIYDSRVLTTRHLVDALPARKDITLISASGAGYYGDRGDDILTENDANGNDFLAGVCQDWEGEAFRAKNKGVRVATTRFGVVLGKNGGAMEKMESAFRFFVGGPMGDGMQWFPWIHLNDLISAMILILEHQHVAGPFNFCSPHPVRNGDLAKTMGRILKRPSFMPAPAFVMRLALGEFAGTLLGSQRAIPEKLLSNGFSFQYADIDEAIKNIIK
ncbi:MAG: TIGR01777 family oxidoreductase [Desulfobacterales bacterium]|nr:MAG: TIGR01777 family oxidoreductase [Desulfobacterales bacterium]